MEPIPSSTARASICRSTGRASAGVVACALGLFLVERPLRSRRNDSRRVFLNDLRRDSVSPAPVKSKKIRNIITDHGNGDKHSKHTIRIQRTLVQHWVLGVVIEQNQSMSRAGRN